jgi:hypothetical protein
VNDYSIAIQQSEISIEHWKFIFSISLSAPRRTPPRSILDAAQKNPPPRRAGSEILRKKIQGSPIPGRKSFW